MGKANELLKNTVTYLDHLASVVLKNHTSFVDWSCAMYEYKKEKRRLDPACCTGTKKQADLASAKASMGDCHAAKNVDGV